ncbi:MerR family transcriptional regulator [Bacterioplanes sanyensis]|uniref:MerR family transcriptional regulator n=1 Tax=Bacterioplanes sanyensis TaxID=1249553 RepID=A0A222FQ50_9GAMM|nr:MerR family transcriptional regulator [Bacterioplanes sanyensis]ASP40644.1 MerR family transcriptional regulator [Bacterioplanes sanyensis]
MKIGELSQRTAVSIRMLRYYEEQGLLQPKRTVAGYRDYRDSEVATVTRIKLLSDAGMPLSTIQVFLPCIRSDGPVFEPCDELRKLLKQQIHQTDDTLQKLQNNRQVLANFLREIEAADN